MTLRTVQAAQPTEAEEKKMVNLRQGHTDRSDHTKSLLAGLLMGGLAGTAVMMLLAPQSGEKTRDQIQSKVIELRDEATETADNAVSQVRRKSKQVSTEVGEKVEELKQRSEKLIDEQRDHLSTILATENNEVKVSS